MIIFNHQATTLRLPFRLVMIILFSFTSWHLSAQAKLMARYELPYRGSDHEFIIQPMGARGLALIRDEDKYEKGKKK